MEKLMLVWEETLMMIDLLFIQKWQNMLKKEKLW